MKFWDWDPITIGRIMTRVQFFALKNHSTLSYCTVLLRAVCFCFPRKMFNQEKSTRIELHETFHQDSPHFHQSEEEVVQRLLLQLEADRSVTGCTEILQQPINFLMRSGGTSDRKCCCSLRGDNVVAHC